MSKIFFSLENIGKIFSKHNTTESNTGLLQNMFNETKVDPHGQKNWNAENGQQGIFKGIVPECPADKRLEAGESVAHKIEGSSRLSIRDSSKNEEKYPLNETAKVNSTESENEKLGKESDKKKFHVKKLKRPSTAMEKLCPKLKEEAENLLIKEEVSPLNTPTPILTPYYTTYIRDKNARCKRLFKLVISDEKDNCSLLSNAIDQQEVVLELLQKEREALRKRILLKREVKIKPKKSSLLDFESPSRVWRVKSKVGIDPKSLAVGDYYYSNLDEIFQAWIHLFSFIINLRINLINMVNVGKKDWFKPSPLKEKELIRGATECVKLYSKFKTKWLSQYFEELRSVDSSKSTTHITNYEERTSSPFLQELQYMVSKGKEMVEQMKIKDRDRRMTA